jgi:uncharacterized YccA/Bax inhibitor family protein
MATITQGNPLLSDARVAKVRGELTGTHSTMTVGGTITATLALLVVFLAAGAVGWSAAYDSVTEVTNPVTGEITYQGSLPGWIFVAMLVGVGAGFATAFVPKIAMFTGFIYALGYGAAIGAISGFYEMQFDGIVGQAVLTTVGVFLAVLVAYATGIIKVTGKFVMTILLAMAGIFAMFLVGWIAAIFGADIAFWNEPTPMGIGISIVIAIVAALSLAIDFAFIDRGTQEGLPKQMEWYGAFALLSGLVWLYITILRILALARQS